MAYTLIQIQSYLFIINQPKVSLQFLILRRVPTWYLLLHTILVIQFQILRLQMGSTTFKGMDEGLDMMMGWEEVMLGYCSPIFSPDSWWNGEGGGGEECPVWSLSTDSLLCCRT